MKRKILILHCMLVALGVLLMHFNQFAAFSLVVGYFGGMLAYNLQYQSKLMELISENDNIRKEVEDFHNEMRVAIEQSVRDQIWNRGK